jgi:hypothetical protein
MSWKNWGDHPVVVGIGIIGVLAGLGYTIYDHHVKQEDTSKSGVVASKPTDVVTSTQTAPTTPSIPSSNESVGSLEIYRQPTSNGSIYGVKVEVDGKEVGNLWGGETLKYAIPTGEHIVRVSGGWLYSSVVISVKGDQKLKFQTKFSDFGLLGGGLRLDRIY